jgi:hypothetical protein
MVLDLATATAVTFSGASPVQVLPLLSDMILKALVLLCPISTTSECPYRPPLLNPVLISVQAGVGMVGRCAAWTGTLPPP